MNVLDIPLLVATKTLRLDIKRRIKIEKLEGLKLKLRIYTHSKQYLIIIIYTKQMSKTYLPMTKISAIVKEETNNNYKIESSYLNYVYL